MFVELVFFWNGANNHNRKYKGRDSDEKRNVLAFVSGFSADTLWLRHFGGRLGERADVEFTVVPAEEVPQELSEILEKNKAREIRMTYQDGEELYLIRGYGEQKTGGYSISVVECSEDEENLYFLTQLIGPEDPEGLSEDPSYPYLVAKTARTDKNVEID